VLIPKPRPQATIGNRKINGAQTPLTLMTEASILPVNKRPRIAIRIYTSN
jgi:hypothetical protein